MATIKEKAEERAPYTKKDSWDRIKAAINAQTSFEAGANYVLDEVECILEDNNLWDCEEICYKLKELIEQLKK